MMESIRRVLNTSLAKKGLVSKLDTALIIEAFKKLLVADFGQEVIGKIKNISFRRGSLNLSTESSPFKKAVNIREVRYLKELQKIYGSELVKKITYFS